MDRLIEPKWIWNCCSHSGICQNLAQLRGANVYRRQKVIKTEPLNRETVCTLIHSGRNRGWDGSANKMDRQSRHWLKLRAFTAITQTCLLHLISSMYPGATSMCLRRLCFAATPVWTPWWLAEPSDLVAHTLVHTLGITDKGPFSLLNLAFPSLFPSRHHPSLVCFNNCLPPSLIFNSFLPLMLLLPPLLLSSLLLFLCATSRWLWPRLLCTEWLFIECHAGR